ncbi:hypothetical protein ABZS86_34085 [Streptomyces sp. NPDC005355]|uniref:hypothetical protein n=1 Tax=Streptomyces sp. NPDC005355 TaxID=3157038 RepID=UPI0033B35882
MTHLQLGTPMVWCWDNLNVHLVRNWRIRRGAQGLATAYQMPSYVPELNPAEETWALLKQHLADFAAAVTHLTRDIKPKLKKIGTGPT